MTQQEIDFMKKQHEDLKKCGELAKQTLNLLQETTNKLKAVIEERDAALAVKDEAINLMIKAGTKVIFKDLTEKDKEILKAYEPGDSYKDTGDRIFASKSKVEQAWKKILKSPTPKSQKLVQEMLKACGII